jgi:hypothetical protein
MSRRRIVLSIVGLLVLLAVAGWALGLYRSTDQRRFDTVADLANEVARCESTGEDGARTSSDATANKLYQDVRASRYISCGPPDHLGGLLVVVRFNDRAALVRARDEREARTAPICVNYAKDELYRLFFDPPAQNAAFCARVGASKIIPAG